MPQRLSVIQLKDQHEKNTLIMQNLQPSTRPSFRFNVFESAKSLQPKTEFKKNIKTIINDTYRLKDVLKSNKEITNAKKSIKLSSSPTIVYVKNHDETQTHESNSFERSNVRHNEVNPVKKLSTDLINYSLL